MFTSPYGPGKDRRWNPIKKRFGSCLTALTQMRPAHTMRQGRRIRDKIFRPRSGLSTRQLQLILNLRALGTLLSATKKFDEAIPVWKKLIEIAPHDSSGFANLGFVYLRQKNYKDALSQFEAAAKLQPDQPGWQMQVGISYLHTGSEDSAVDSFKKAMELDSGANTLNAVAYELANANIRLSEALQYAEKAVHSA